MPLQDLRLARDATAKALLALDKIEKTVAAKGQITDGQTAKCLEIVGLLGRALTALRAVATKSLCADCVIRERQEAQDARDRAFRIGAGGQIGDHIWTVTDVLDCGARVRARNSSAESQEFSAATWIAAHAIHWEHNVKPYTERG